MNRRKLLKLAVVLVAFIGLLATVSPFVRSLTLNAAAGKDLQRLKVGTIAAGQMRWFDDANKVLPPHSQYSERYLVVRYADESFHVFRFPVKDGLIGMPDIHPWQIDWWCKQFELQDPAQPIGPHSVIQCMDIELRQPGSRQWQWTLDGKGIGGSTSDLERPRFVVEHGEVVLGKT